MPVKNYRDLVVWQKAMDLVIMVYRSTAAFPHEELYGLRNQLRRAAVSIPSNIAEGQGRHTTREFLSFLSIANGSLREVETQSMIASRLHYITEERESELLGLAAEVGRLRNGLVTALKKR